MKRITRSRSLLALCSAAVLAASPFVQKTSAVVDTWTLNGSDNWESVNWISGGGPNPWPSVGEDADFTTVNLTGNRTVTLTAPETVGNMSFGDTDITTGFNWLIAGVSPDTLTINAPVNINVSTMGNANPNFALNITSPSINRVEISASITGTGGITLNGAGVLRLSGSNSFTGGVTINNGELTLVDAGFQPPSTSIAEAGTGTVTLNGGVLHFLSTGGTTPYYFNNNMVLNGGVIFSEDGSNHIGTDGLGDFATINVTGPTEIRRLWGQNNVDKNVYLDGVLTGSGALLVDGAANQFAQAAFCFVTNPNNSYSGTLTVNGAGSVTTFAQTTAVGFSLVVGSDTALQFATVNVNTTAGTTRAIQFNDTTANNGGSVLTGTTVIFGALSGNGTFGLRGLTVNSAVNLSVGGNNATTTYSGIITGGGNLAKTGTGLMTLSGTNTYTGGTTISGVGGVGGIVIGADSGLGGTAGPLAIGAGKLEITSAAGYTSGRVVTVTDNAATIQVDSATATVINSAAGANAISGGGGLNKTGLGTYVLNTQGTYSGPTNVSAGKLTATGGLTGGLVTIAGGATLGASTGGFAGGITSNGGAITMVDGATHTVTSPGGLTLNAGSALGLEIGPSGAADKIDATGGTLTLTGNTTLSITALSGFGLGTYDVIDFSSLSGAGNILFSNSSTVAHGSDNLAGVPASPGVFTYTLSRTSGSELLTITANLASALYWTGKQNTAWNTLSSGNTNWSTAPGGTPDANQTPIAGVPDVVFIQSADPTNANLATTLGVDTSVKGVSFAGTMTSAVTINGANTLTVGADGIAVDAGSGGHTFNETGSAGNPGIILLVPQTWTNNSNNPLTINSSVGGTPALSLAGTGVIVLNGSNTYSGGTTLFGSVKVGNASALGTGPVNFDPSSLDLNNTALVVSLITGTGTITNTGTGAASLTINGAGSGTFTGVIQNGNGTASVIMAGAGVETLVGSQTYTGGTTINAGTLQIGDGNTLSALTGNVISNGTLGMAVPSGQGQTFSNVITGTGGFAGNGTGALTVTSSNSYSGTTTISGGKLTMGHVNALGAGGRVTLNNNGILDVNGFSPTIGSLASDGNFGNTVTNLATGTTALVTINQNAATSYNGNFNDGNGTLNLLVTGTGTLTLQSAPAIVYTGNVTVSGGATVALGADSQNTENPAILGSGNVTLQSGGKLRLGGQGGSLANYTVSNPITFNNGSVLANDGGQYLTGSITVQAGGAQISSNWTGKDVYVEGPLMGSGPVAISGGFNGGDGGTVHIGTSGGFFGFASNTYNGTVTVNPGGTLSVGSQFALANAPLVVNGTLAFDAAGGQPIFIGGLTGTGTVNLADVSSTPVNLNIGQGGASTTFNGILAGASGGSLTKVGNGTFTITQKATYTGTTLVSGGTLRLTPTPAALPTPLGHFTLDGTLANSAGTAGGMSNGVLDTTQYYAGANVQGGFVPGVSGQAFNFNANVSIDITLSSSATLALKNNNWTVSFWENYTDPNSGGFLSKGSATALTANGTGLAGTGLVSGDTVFQGGNGGYYAGNYAGMVENGGSWNVASTSGQALNDGNWHLVTYSSTGGNTSIYVDGVLSSPKAQTYAIPATLADAGTVIRLGWDGLPLDGHQPANGANRYYGAFNVLDGGTAADAHTPGFYSGMLDDVYFFNAALTPTQVQALYAVNSNAAQPISLLPTSAIVQVSAGATLAMTATAPGSPKQLLNVSLLSIDGATTGGTIAPTGTIDMGNNHAIIQDYQYSTDEVRQLIRSGYAGGTWTGTGITTTSAVPGQGLGYLNANEYTALTGLTSWDGVTLFGAQTLVKYTYQGDANLDGKVTISDYAQIDANFLLGVTGPADWADGDFNYDGVVDYRDYALIDFAFLNQGGGALADSMIAEHTAEFGQAYVDALAADGVAAVPEPASLALLAVGALGLLRRRR